MEYRPFAGARRGLNELTKHVLEPSSMAAVSLGVPAWIENTRQIVLVTETVGEMRRNSLHHAQKQALEAPRGGAVVSA